MKQYISPNSYCQKFPFWNRYVNSDEQEQEETWKWTEWGWRLILFYEQARGKKCNISSVPNPVIKTNMSWFVTNLITAFRYKMTPWLIANGVWSKHCIGWSLELIKNTLCKTEKEVQHHWLIWGNKQNSKNTSIYITIYYNGSSDFYCFNVKRIITSIITNYTSVVCLNSW